MKKVLLPVLLFLLFIHGSARSDDALNVTRTVIVGGYHMESPEKPNWGWAAAVRSVLKVSGVRVEQRDIVEAVYRFSSDKPAPAPDKLAEAIGNIKPGGYILQAVARQNFSADWLFHQLGSNIPVTVYVDGGRVLVIYGGEYRMTGPDIVWNELYIRSPEKGQQVIPSAKLSEYMKTAIDIEVE